MSEQDPGHEVLNFKVIGSARPERRNWYFEPFGFRSGHFSFLAEMRGSRFVASMDVPVVDKIDLLTARNTAATYLRTMVDAIGYLNGAAIEADVTEVIGPDGRLFALDPEVLELRHPDYTAEDIRLLVSAAVNDHAVRLGLADIRQAIRGPEDTAFLCYRAIEGVMQRFGAWEKMHEVLGTDRDEIMRIKEWADPRRHGDHADLTHEQRIESLVLAHRVVGLYASHVFDGLPQEAKARDDDRWHAEGADS